MILFLLDHPSQLKLCKEKISAMGSSAQQCRIFAPAINTKDAKDLQSLWIIPPELTRDEKEMIDDKGTRLAERWALDQHIVRRIKYRRINLGTLVTHGLDYFWIWSLKQVVLLDKVLTQLNPAKVILWKGPSTMGPYFRPKESYVARAGELFCQSRGIAYEAFSTDEDYRNGTPKQSSRSRLLKDLAKLILQVLEFGSSLMLSMRSSKPRVGMLMSLRMGEGLLTGGRSPFDWVFLSLLGGPRAALKVASLGVPILYLTQISTQKKHEYKPNWEDLICLLSKNRELMFRDIDLSQLAQERFKQIFSEEFSRLAVWIDSMEVFLKKSRLDLLVVDEDVTPIHKALVEVAAQQLISSVVIQHGITGQRRGFVPFSSVRMAAWGEISKKQLMNWGIPGERISTVGFPPLKNSVFSRVAKDKTVIRKNIGLKENGNIILYAPNRLIFHEEGRLRIKMTPQEGIKYHEMIIRACLMLPDVRVVVKLHPGNSFSDFSKILKDIGFDGDPRIIILEKGNLRELMEISDVLITAGSTVCIEAMLLDIPTVNVIPPDKENYIPFEKPEPVYGGTTSEEIADSLNRALQNPDELSDQRKKFLDSYCGRNPKKTVQNIKALIVEELKKAARLRNYGIIVQARMSSERLRGKVLHPVKEKPALRHLMDRLTSVCDKNRIVIATSSEKSDDPIEAFCKENRIQYFRGSLHDVLDRYYQAATHYSFDPIIRITGDAPLIEPAYIRDLLWAYRDFDCDYIGAKDPKIFPRGTTGELINYRSLEDAWKKSTALEDREHVTWFIRNRANQYRLKSLSPRAEWAGYPMRLALDENADLEVIQGLFDRFYDKNPLFGLDEVSTFYDLDPSWFNKNINVKSKHNYVGSEMISQGQEA